MELVPVLTTSGPVESVLKGLHDGDLIGRHGAITLGQFPGELMADLPRPDTMSDCIHRLS